MLDLERKRQMDRARRARIKAGSWDFPNGGDARLAKAGASGTSRAPSPLARASARKPAVGPLLAIAATPPASLPAPAPSGRPPGSSTRGLSPARSGAVARGDAPTSTYAVGGRPGRGLVPQGRGYALPPDIAATSNFTRFQTDTLAMLHSLAARSDAQEARIATLEKAAADRRGETLKLAQAVASVFWRLARSAG